MDIDLTYLFQLGLFLVCLVTLNGLLLKPFLKVIQERDAKMAGAREQSEQLQKDGDDDMAAYQARIREARAKAQEAREALKNEGRDEERQLLAQVRAEIADRLNAARRDINEAEQEARRNLSSDTEALARRLVEKVLGREVAA